MSVESKIDVGSRSFREICFRGREVDGWQFLEDEWEEELAKQGIITIPIKAAKSKRFLISIYIYIADILF